MIDLPPDGSSPGDGRTRAYPALVAVLSALALTVSPTSGNAQETHAMATGDARRMVMPTEDAKLLRLVRPTVAALQVKLALAGHFTGSINGLYGPSTQEAMAAYQETRDRRATGWSHLADVLALMNAERGVAERFADRMDLGAPPGTDERGPSVLPAGGTLAGDPQPAKRIRSMSGRMVAENDHVRALRTLRVLVGAVQVRLAETTHYAGPHHGAPGRARTVGGAGRLATTSGVARHGQARPTDLARTLQTAPG